ncbi:Gfo/Idh/MocA family protein [Pendulispora albinea]|uniref:Gfo/Idh/MocA family oxidoreductase n=1 Tax=Pendulispora albinea TaxID=2741071 RepID=A0ABZ2LXJ9_9BACT
MANRWGVGIIGGSTERGWASAAHIPALRSLPEYEIRAVSTRRRASAERSARALGITLAFDDHRELLARPEVDIALVSVNVTQHRELALAAIEAGKTVVCEWPLGKNLAEAEEIAGRAKKRGVKTLIGLQGRFAPAVRYLRDLVADGYIGRLLGTRIAGAGPDTLWAGVLDLPYEFSADIDNGNTLLSIPAAHALEQLSFALGDIVSVSSTLIARRGQAVRLRDQAIVPMTAHDQVAFSGTLEGGALVSVHYHGGPVKGPVFVWEVRGTEGEIVLSTEHGYPNISELEIQGGRGDEPSKELSIPAEYRLAPPEANGAATNVASMYVQFARDLAEGTELTPDFDLAVRRHRLIDAIERANATGVRQTV